MASLPQHLQDPSFQVTSRVSYWTQQDSAHRQLQDSIGSGFQPISSAQMPLSIPQSTSLADVQLHSAKLLVALGHISQKIITIGAYDDSSRKQNSSSMRLARSMITDANGLLEPWTAADISIVPDLVHHCWHISSDLDDIMTSLGGWKSGEDLQSQFTNALAGMQQAVRSLEIAGDNLRSKQRRHPAAGRAPCNDVCTSDTSQEWSRSVHIWGTHAQRVRKTARRSMSAIRPRRLSPSPSQPSVLATIMKLPIRSPTHRCEAEVCGYCGEGKHGDTSCPLLRNFQQPYSLTSREQPFLDQLSETVNTHIPQEFAYSGPAYIALPNTHSVEQNPQFATEDSLASLPNLYGCVDLANPFAPDFQFDPPEGNTYVGPIGNPIHTGSAPGQLDPNIIYSQPVGQMSVFALDHQQENEDTKLDLPS